MASREDMLEVEIIGSSWQDIYDKAVKHGERFFMVEQHQIDVLPFVSTPEETVNSDESSDPIRITYTATVVVTPK